MAQSTAAKVFATPELLENILLQYAQDFNPRDLKAPVLALFVWQRIDKTTKNIIMGSVNLRRHMMLGLFQEGSEKADDMKARTPSNVDPSFIAPLYWLFSRVTDERGRLCLVGTSLKRDLVYLGMFSTYTDPELNYEPEVRTFPQTMMSPEASWRSICAVRVADHECASGLIVPCDLHGRANYLAMFSIDKEKTLGECWDWYAEVNGRNHTEHCKYLENLMIMSDSWESPWYVEWDQDEEKKYSIEELVAMEPEVEDAGDTE